MIGPNLERRTGMKKRLVLLMASLALSAAMAVPAFAGTWKYENEQWKYQRGTNNYVYNDWVEDNGNWYYMNNSGWMLTGWQSIEGSWYYFDETGVRQTGWHEIEGKWYFMYPNGMMAANAVVNGRQLGADGAWIPAEGETTPVNVTDLATPYLVQNMLDRITTKGYNIITSGKNADGNRWSNAIRLKGEGSYVQTALNGEYTLLTGYVAPSSQFSSSLMAKIIVYGDNDQVLYTSKDIHYNEKAFYFGADVTGQNQIRVEVSLTVDNDWDEPVILMDGLSLYK